MLWIALAAQFSAPEPIKFSTWFSSDDTPAFLVRKGGIRFVGIAGIVRPNGRLRSCKVEYHTDNDPTLDALTCKLFRSRARYRSARWMDRTPVYGVDRFPFMWAVVDSPQRIASPADLELDVNHLPEGTTSPVYVAVTFAAEANGQIVSCAVDKRRPKEGSSKDAALVSIACKQVAANFIAIPVADEKGKPVRSVQNSLVRFTMRNQR